MLFAEFLANIPAVPRLLLAVALTVGITLAFARVFYSRSLLLSQQRPDAEEVVASDGATLKVPMTTDLVSRLLTFSNFAFVFLLGFTYSQFWSNVNTAANDNNTFTTSFVQASTITGDLPSGPARDILVSAFADYQIAVTENQWPHLVMADQDAASWVQYDAATSLLDAVKEASAVGATSAPSWGYIESAINDMLDDAVDVIQAVPGHEATSIILLIFLMGIANLALIAIFQVTRPGMYYLVLGILAGLTGAMFFMIVELSNPFAGATAVRPMLLDFPVF